MQNQAPEPAAAAENTGAAENAAAAPQGGENVVEAVGGDVSIVGTLVDTLEGMLRGLVAALPLLAIAAIVLVIVAILARGVSSLAGKAAQKAGERRSLVDLTETLAKVGVWIVGLLLVMTIVFPSMTLGSLIAALGIGSVAIGFAFQDVFENFLAGVLLMLREKMRIGDYIICEGVEGEVTNITLRETYLRRLSNEITVVPNSHLFKNPVEIITDATMRRHEITAGVSYDTDADMARDLIQKTVEGCELVDSEKPVQVFAAAFGASSIDYTVRWWSGSKPIDMHKSRDEVIRRIKRALDDAGVEIPFPYRTLTFKEPLPLLQQGPKDEG
ncbi:mechanosensitive ion channel protein MscS [Pacificimonas flava]|uniref:Small-conductance mechanosensitive channel n=2 Tax=Pacificimonas TaxID=1960290 RepID=A0A219B2D4_9SPHN|nr:MULTISPECIES: mechanosensitive ion channel family protein [Pacificimonas]MBZ6378073.1 mechanosensitive ion channel family protein [Pacificimonas aurantium]OWV32286.1 mechanosensitive ion channel protein MscS [Pacificimonas flava]